MNWLVILTAWEIATNLREAVTACGILAFLAVWVWSGGNGLRK